MKRLCRFCRIRKAVHGAQCWHCKKFRTRAHRREKWNNEFIGCFRHPEKRCLRTGYILSAHRNCSWCLRHRADGTCFPSVKRNRKSWKKTLGASAYRRRRMLRRSLNVSMKKRRSYGCHSLSLQGLKLFERITGVNYATQI